MKSRPRQLIAAATAPSMLRHSLPNAALIEWPPVVLGNEFSLASSGLLCSQVSERTLGESAHAMAPPLVAFSSIPRSYPPAEWGSLAPPRRPLRSSLSLPARRADTEGPFQHHQIAAALFQVARSTSTMNGKGAWSPAWNTELHRADQRVEPYPLAAHLILGQPAESCLWSSLGDRCAY